MFGLLQNLLGKRPPGQPYSDIPPPAVAAQAPQTPPPVPEETIEVSSRPFQNDLREGLLRGSFGVGRTGGNILGLLGDALLVGTGHDAIYQPRVQRAREAEALIDYTDDPRRAIAQLSQVNPERATELWDRLQERQSQTAYRDAQIRAADDEYNSTTHDRALAFLGAATPTTYPAIKQVVDKWYRDRGVDPIFQLPDQWDEEAIRSIAAGGIPVPKQAELDSQREYREAVLALDRIEEQGRTRRTQLTQSAADRRLREAEAGRDRRLQVQEEGRDRRDDDGLIRPNIRFGKRADGTRYVIR